MVDLDIFMALDLQKQIRSLYEEGSFIMSIRYYGYKINLFLYNGYYIEVFYNHKEDKIEKILPLDTRHSRMNFYADQIKLATA